MRTRPLPPILIGAIYLSLAPFGHGASIASDLASNYTTTTWITGSNLGSGFGAWNLDNSLSKAIESSSVNGGTPNIDSDSSAFRITRAAGQSGFAQIQRTFTAGGSNGLQELGAGQSFQFSMDLEGLNAGASVGFWLTDGGNGERWGFQATGGQTFLQIKTNGGTAVNTTIPLAGLNNGSDVVFTLGAAGAWSATFSRLETGGSVFNLDSTTFGAIAANPTGFRFFQANNTNNGTLTHYINNLAVVPEPGSMALLGLAAVASISRRRRRP